MSRTVERILGGAVLAAAVWATGGPEVLAGEAIASDSRPLLASAFNEEAVDQHLVTPPMTPNCEPRAISPPCAPSQTMPGAAVPTPIVPGTAMPSQAMPPAPGPSNQSTLPMPSMNQPSGQGAMPSPFASAFEGAGGAGMGEMVASIPPGGYIDSAVPFSNVRLRFDAQFDDRFPNAAEFIYGQRIGGIGNPGGISGTGNVNSVNLQELSLYLEYAFGRNFSVFADVPVRWVEYHPSAGNQDQTGLSDVSAGFKWALVADPCQYFTFQLRAYAPSGDVNLGLGTGHTSLEPALLYYERRGDVTVQGELRDWIPIGGSDFAGNVVRYGVGLGYYAHESQEWSLIPNVEIVGWTILSGEKSNLITPEESARGDTIVNVKVGARLVLGGSGVPFAERSSLYAGWGHAITGDAWYRDIARVEYRIVF